MRTRLDGYHGVATAAVDQRTAREVPTKTCITPNRLAAATVTIGGSSPSWEHFLDASWGQDSYDAGQTGSS